MARRREIKQREFLVTRQEAEDLQSAVWFWSDKLDHKSNPDTAKALVKLQARLTKFCKTEHWWSDEVTPPKPQKEAKI